MCGIRVIENFIHKKFEVIKKIRKIQWKKMNTAICYVSEILLTHSTIERCKCFGFYSYHPNLQSNKKETFLR